jgi:hypothetical protein
LLDHRPLAGPVLAAARSASGVGFLRYAISRHFAPFRAAWSEFPCGAALKPLLAATRMRLAAVKFSAQVGRLNAVAVTPNTASQAMDSAS